MKADIGPPDLRDVNITVLDGSSVSFDEVVATSSTVPFLADKRMVIVDGLLTEFETRTPSRQRGRTATVSERSLGQWARLPEHLAQLPATTELVFVDGRLGESNAPVWHDSPAGPGTDLSSAEGRPASGVDS